MWVFPRTTSFFFFTSHSSTKLVTACKAISAARMRQAKTTLATRSFEWGQCMTGQHIQCPHGIFLELCQLEQSDTARGVLNFDTKNHHHHHHHHHHIKKEKQHVLCPNGHFLCFPHTFTTSPNIPMAPRNHRLSRSACIAFAKAKHSWRTQRSQGSHWVERCAAKWWPPVALFVLWLKEWLYKVIHPPGLKWTFQMQKKMEEPAIFEGKWYSSGI